MKSSRRKFLANAALTSASLAVGAEALSNPTEQTQRSTDAKRAQTMQLASGPKQPVMITKTTGIQSIDQAYQMLLGGQDTLDAVLHVCEAQEDDPNDDTVGLGGLPNEEGVVELDACCMHGPTRRAGAVAAVREIKNVVLVARKVMERTDHLFLVGEGAQRFAVAQGFPKENLLTERSRKIWLLWKENMSDQDSWGPGISDPNWKPPARQNYSAPGTPPQASIEQRRKTLYEKAANLGIEPEYREQAVLRVLFPPTGTIHCSAVNAKGEMSGATTTSGLAWKIPGRVGDSPIIGAGCFTDQDVGSAGATGSGEENIKIAGAHTIVELMRGGLPPQQAGLEALRRIARNHNNNMDKLRYLGMVYYILRKDGAYAGVSLWSHSPSGKPIRFTVHDGTKRLENCVALFQGTPIDWPPTPQLPPNA